MVRPYFAEVRVQSSLISPGVESKVVDLFDVHHFCPPEQVEYIEQQSGTGAADSSSQPREIVREPETRILDGRSSAGGSTRNEMAERVRSEPCPTVLRKWRATLPGKEPARRQPEVEGKAAIRL